MSVCFCLNVMVLLLMFFFLDEARIFLNLRLKSLNFRIFFREIISHIFPVELFKFELRLIRHERSQRLALLPTFSATASHLMFYQTKNSFVFNLFVYKKIPSIHCGPE